jgi:hypothetical protein
MQWFMQDIIKQKFYSLSQRLAKKRKANTILSMKLKRKQVGYILYVDNDNTIKRKEPKYKMVYEEPNLVRLLKTKEFYLCLIIPSLMLLLIYLTPIKIMAVLLSIAFTLTLIPLWLTIKEVFSIFD